tara:strand:+ start:2563 stop:2778 length:216 start_codon:yes stop_codon:yes gene_type:complete
MKYFQTFINKLLNLLGMKKQPTFAFKKNKIDFISMPEGMSEKERLIRFTEALRKQGWTVTDKHGLLDKSDE